METRRSTKSPFGELLRRRRIQAGLSQAQLAERARISVQAVSALERGARSAPRTDTLTLLVDSLELDPSERETFERIARESVKQKVRGYVDREQGAIANLPRFDTTFVGRKREREELHRIVKSGRCATIWGYGGIGKTRLAACTAQDLRGAFDGDVVFIALAAAISAVDLSVAAGLGITERPGAEVRAQIIEALENRRALIVLDNCEHVHEAAADLVTSILERAPKNAVLCTSREPLRVRDENVVAIEPFEPLDAVRLFMDRSHGDRDDTAAIEAICKRLEGIPLAIELAAALTRALEIAAIDRALDDRMLVLTRGSRTMRATIAWSYGLLAPNERLVFERVAVINGKAKLEDIIAVAADGELQVPAVIDAVASLVDKALLSVEPGCSGAARTYRLLEATRAFAASLDARERADRDLAAAHRRFGAHLADVATRATDATRDGDETLLAAIDADNVRGYLHWAIESEHDAVQAASVAGKLSAFWDYRGLQLEGLRWINASLERFPSGDRASAQAEITALTGAATLHMVLAQYRQGKLPATRAYDLAIAIGDDHLRAVAAKNVALCMAATGEHAEAQTLIDESIALFAKERDPVRYRLAVASGAVIAARAGRHAVARDRFIEAVEEYLRAGNRRYAARVRVDVGEAHFALGEIDEAIATGRFAVEELREFGTALLVAKQLNNLGAYLVAAQRFDEAAACSLESLDICRGANYVAVAIQAMRICASIGTQGASVEDLTRFERCAELFAYVDRHMRAGDLESGYTEIRIHEDLRARLAAVLSQTQLAAATARGEAYGDDRADAVARELLELVDRRDQ